MRSEGIIPENFKVETTSSFSFFSFFIVELPHTRKEVLDELVLEGQ